MVLGNIFKLPLLALTFPLDAPNIFQYKFLNLLSRILATAWITLLFSRLLFVSSPIEDVRKFGERISSISGIELYSGVASKNTSGFIFFPSSPTGEK